MAVAASIASSISLIKLPSVRNLQVRLINRRTRAFYTPIIVSSIGALSCKWREARVSAAATTAVEGGEVDVEEESSEEKGAVKLYFGNLPYNVDSSVLAGIVQVHATPELIEVLYDRDTGKSRGFAFVTMSNIQDANTVIENLHGTEYGGRILRVNFSDKPKPKEALYPETEHKLFVGNVSWSVTSETLRLVFQEYGNVVGARILFDGETGRSRGYGFVCYSSKTEMENALASLDGLELEGRAIRVTLAQGKNQ